MYGRHNERNGACTERLTSIWPDDRALLDIYIILVGLLPPNDIIFESIHASGRVYG